MSHPADDLQAQRLAAQALVGKLVIFDHWVDNGHCVDNGPPLRVSSAENGMVTLQGFAGRFAPHLFKVVEEEHRS